MSNEARVQSALSIRKTDPNGLVLIDYASRPSGFLADVAGAKGPVPGALTIQRNFTIISLSQLNSPGFCRFANLGLYSGAAATGDTGLIEVGFYDANSPEFYPFLEIYPGESFVVRLSRFLNREITTGTGTTPHGNSVLAAKATGAPTILLAEAFER